MDNGRKKNILLGVLIVGVISMTVAFAALATNLRINGTANVAATRWNIHFDHWALDTQSTITVGGNTQHNTAEYPQVSGLTMADNSNVTKVSGINVTLHQPNDYVKYTFDIVNDGTIDGQLSNFDRNITCSGNNCEEVVDYTVACTDSGNNDALETDYILPAGATINCYLQIKYKDVDNVAKEASNKVQANVAGTNQRYTQSALTISVSPTWTWVQSTETNGYQQGGSGGNTPAGNACVPPNCYVGPTGETQSPSLFGSEWTDELNSDWLSYYKYTGTNVQLCGVFGTTQKTTICLDPNPQGYNNDFANCSYDNNGYSADCLTGYTKTKVDAMKATGATCSVYYDGDNTASNVSCDIQDIYPTMVINKDGSIRSYWDSSGSYYVRGDSCYGESRCAQ